MNVSLCASFLLKIAKQADIELRTPQQTSHHTVRAAAGDINEMVTHLLKHKVTCEQEHRKGGTPFSDPLVKGAAKVGSIEKYINNIDDSETATEVTEENEVDLSYELCNTD